MWVESVVSQKSLVIIAGGIVKMKYNEYMVLMNPSRPQGEGKGGEVRWMTCCETPELKEAIGISIEVQLTEEECEINKLGSFNKENGLKACCFDAIGIEIGGWEKVE